MRTSALFGVLFIAVGLFLLIYGTIIYNAAEYAMDMVLTESYLENKKDIPLPLAFGGLALAGGVFLFFMSTRRPI